MCVYGACRQCCLGRAGPGGRGGRAGGGGAGRGGGLGRRYYRISQIFFLLSTIFYLFFSHTTQHNIQKTKQQTHTQHLKVQSKWRGRGKDNKNTKVTPLYNHVYSTKNTAKHQWSKAWPHQLAPLYIHMRQFAGGCGSNMFFYTCVV